MNISYLSDLEKLESKIKRNLKKHKLGDTLNSLYIQKPKLQNLEPFMVGGFALFAIRFCPPSKSSEFIRRYDITSLINLSNDYYLADPITFDTDLSNEFKHSNPVFMMLRLVSSQFPFNPGLFSEFARPALLFDEIPKKLKGLSHIPEFDFESKFKAITGVSVIDFITTGFIIYAVSKSNFTFSLDYLKKFREKRINTPDHCTLRKIINQLAADQFQLIKLYEERKNQDRRFRMYDFNPIIQYPLIKPCQNKGFSNSYKPTFRTSKCSI